MSLAFRFAYFILLRVAAGNLLGNYRKDVKNDKANRTFFPTSIEIPIITGACIIFILFVCACYHVCYRRLYLKEPIFMTVRQSTNVTDIQATMFRAEEGVRRRQDFDNPPDYTDLPPSYRKLLILDSCEKNKQISSAPFEEPPPDYEDFKEDPSQLEKIV